MKYIIWLRGEVGMYRFCFRCGNVFVEANIWCFYFSEDLGLMEIQGDDNLKLY